MRMIAFCAMLALCAGWQRAAASAPLSHWVGSWAAAPMGEQPQHSPALAAESTYRNIVHISLGGLSLRVQLTNEFGVEPLMIGEAQIAVSAGEGKIQPGTGHPLTFNGKSTVRIPRGGWVVSDPVPMAAASMSDLAISVYLPRQTITEATCHEDAQATNYVTPGDAASAVDSPGARAIRSWCFVKGVDVSSDDPAAAAIVAFGDSITDGWQSTIDANRRWPDVLAARLLASKEFADRAVLNEGISGNRFLEEGAGPAALARFDRDVIAQSGVKYVILLEGINDIGDSSDPANPDSVVPAQEIIFALTQLATRAHQHNLRVIGATLTPYRGAAYFSTQGERVREAVNQWIRTSSVFDGVIDFDKITADPAQPTAFLGTVDSGDHLHPGDAGYAVMGSSIDLTLFR